VNVLEAGFGSLLSTIDHKTIIAAKETPAIATNVRIRRVSLTRTGMGVEREPAACDVADADADAEELPPAEGKFDASLEGV